MLVQYSDFNGADQLVSGRYPQLWQELDEVLQAMPLHLKDSGQRGKVGKLVFDPIGANHHIKESLAPKNWTPDPAIPGPYGSLGLGVDFAKLGIVGETQFAHYGLLLNNILRSEFFAKARVAFANHHTEALIVITKAAMLPAANSSLYYEQAVGQCALLAKHRAFDVPTRLVGLFVQTNAPVSALHTTYKGGGTSRTVAMQTRIQCVLTPGRTPRCKLAKHS